MNKIIAKGKLHGNETTVECFIENGSPVIEIDGESNPRMQEIFEAALKNPRPLGGTYYPPVDSLLAALSVMESQFFDNEPEITVEGNIGTIPTYNVEGIVY